MARPKRKPKSQRRSKVQKVTSTPTVTTINPPGPQPGLIPKHSAVLRPKSRNPVHRAFRRAFYPNQHATFVQEGEKAAQQINKWGTTVTNPALNTLSEFQDFVNSKDALESVNVYTKGGSQNPADVQGAASITAQPSVPSVLGDATGKLGEIAPGAISGTASTVGGGVSRLGQAASTLGTPGGIGAMFGLLIFLMFTLVPTRSGKSRGELLWLTLR